MFITKLIPVFAYPLGAALVLCLTSLLLMSASRGKLAGLVLATAVAMLWVCSTPLFANWLAGGLEAKNPPVATESLPAADAIVLLGGLIGQPIPPRLTTDLSDAIDRAVFAAALFRAGKAPVIVISAGNLPWMKAAAPEADLIAAFLTESGVPETAILRETESRNTRENAVNTARLFAAQGWTTGLLVTSAAHMPRSLATFRAAGLNLTPASTDVRVTYPYYESPLDLLPDAGALARTSSAIKEHIGLFAYRRAGWAD